MDTKTMLSQIKSLLNAKVNLAQMTLDNGTVIEADEFVAGANVFIVTDGEKVPLPVGEYTLEDGRKLVVESEGVISSFNMEEEEKEEATEEEKEELEETIEVEAPEAVASEIEEVVEAVVEVIAPVIEEVKEQVEEMKKYMEEKKKEEEMEDEKETKMSAQEPASKPIKHSPESKSTPKLKKLSSRRPMSTLDRVMGKISKIQ